jgi:hypothetical protein
MLLDTISICYEKRQNGRSLDVSCYSSSCWLYRRSYELYLPQLDTLSANIKGECIAKPAANYPAPFRLIGKMARIIGSSTSAKMA